MIPINEIYFGDCLDWMKLIDDKSIDLIVTDPPYLINYKTNYRNNKNHRFCRPILNDTNISLIKEYIKECYRILKNNTALYMFCNSNKVDIFKQELEKYFNIKNMIIWVKNNWTAGDLKAQFGKQYEIIFLCNKGRKYIEGKRLTDVWYFDRVSGNKQHGQNQKPVDLIKQCIVKHSLRNALVFDGMCGTGTTAIACLETNRNYIGIELDENYYNITLNRIKQWKETHA